MLVIQYHACHTVSRLAADALAKIMSVTSSVNESIRKHENKLKLKDLEACVPGIAIIRQGRVGPLEHCAIIKSNVALSACHS